jgi:methionyl-tRNA formyltransferase
MRIAYFGYDFFVDCLIDLIAAGHDIHQINTINADNTWDFNKRILSVAEETGCPVSFSKPTPQLITKLIEQGCDLIITAGYPYKIPALDQRLIRGINIHPTFLPYGRGRWPLPWLILKHPEHAGVSIHKLTSEWDSGDILVQSRLTLTQHDDLETLSARSQMTAVVMMRKLLSDFEFFWEACSPQGDNGSYWPMPSRIDRFLDWNYRVDEILKIVRAFSKFESTAVVDAIEYSVTRANGWTAQRREPIGSVVHNTNLEKIIAVSDGYVVLQEFKAISDLRKNLDCKPFR